MKATVAAFSLAAGIGLVCCQSASAVPIDAGAIQQAASAPSDIVHVQYAERRGRGTTTKCYREFVIGSYACHTYRNW